jgi:hypothetical protein
LLERTQPLLRLAESSRPPLRGDAAEHSLTLDDGRKELGAPVEISPPDADVLGAPQAVTTNGHHVIATFAASSEGTFRLVAVPIDDVAAVDASEMTARK